MTTGYIPPAWYLEELKAASEALGPDFYNPSNFVSLGSPPVLLPVVERPGLEVRGEMSITLARVEFDEAPPAFLPALKGPLILKKEKPLKPRKTICPSAWRKGHWSALDRQASVLSQHGRELYEAEKSLLWRQGHPWAYVRQVLEGSILFRAEQESSAAKPNGIEGVPS